MSTQAEDVIKLAFRRSPAAWFEVYGRIKTKRGQIEQPKANEMQRRMCQVYEHCRNQRVPCRIIVLKPRQKGCSTFSTAVLYHHLRNYTAEGCIIGGQASQVENLWEMLRRYRKFDKFDWGNSFEVKGELAVGGHGARLVRETAGDKDSGRSGTLQLLIATEVARWKQGAVINADEILTGILSCVPSLPDTVVFQESTANGASGAFYDRWCGAVEFDDFKAGRMGNGYVKIFFPWFAFEDSEDALTKEREAEVRATLDQVEVDLVDEFGLNMRQVAWRRRTIREECGGDAEIFDQEFPKDEQTAFLKSGRLRFNVRGLKHIEGLTRKYRPELGVLEQHHGGIVFRRTAENEAWLAKWEDPQPRLRYIVPIDPAVGASQTGGDDVDAHALGVLRAGYFQAGRGWLPPRLVARVIAPPKGQADVDLDVLALWAERLCLYFGRCLVVPEMNNSGLALLALLKDKNLPIYQREVFDRRESVKKLALGWQTTPETRPILIETLAAAVRDFDQEGGGLDVCCEHAHHQLSSFVVKPSGKAEAMRGEHDDDVVMLAIGLTTMTGATEYTRAVVERAIPGDIAAWEKGRSREVISTYA